MDYQLEVLEEEENPHLVQLVPSERTLQHSLLELLLQVSVSELQRQFVHLRALLRKVVASEH